MTGDNKLDIIPRAGQLPSWDWKNLGATFASGRNSNAQNLHGQVRFVVRQGYDAVDQTLTDRVVDGTGDLGVTLKSKSIAVGLSLGNLSYKTGNDDPLTSQAVGESSVPSLKVTLAKEVKEDQYVAVSYDVKQKKPEFTLAWSGQTQRDKASLVLHADPLFQSYKLGAAVSFPGPEWREDVYDESKDVIVSPEDDGGRHKLWVQHEVKNRQWGYKTRVGASFDLGRLANWMADFVDYKLEPCIPPLFWRIPLTGMLYNMIVPAEDENQVNATHLHVAWHGSLGGMLPRVHAHGHRSHGVGE